MASTDKKADAFLSIKTEHIANIACKVKTHEFRKYLLPSSVERIWFYTSSPIQRLQYCAVIGNGKVPGEIDAEDKGLGNEEFNLGLKESKYGYEIIHLYELLDEGMPLAVLKEKGFAKGPPQRYQWVKKEMLEYFALEKQKKLF